jgi:hypothetical protein
MSGVTAPAAEPSPRTSSATAATAFYLAQHAAVPLRGMLRSSLRFDCRRLRCVAVYRADVGVVLNSRIAHELGFGQGERGVTGAAAANKKAPRAGEVASRRSRSEHRGSCSQFVAELIAAARLSSSKGCAKLSKSIKTMAYDDFETVCPVTRIVRFGRKAARQVS